MRDLRKEGTSPHWIYFRAPDVSSQEGQVPYSLAREAVVTFKLYVDDKGVGAIDVESSNAVQEICRNFSVGRCRFGDACRHSHVREVCRDFARGGDCRYGDECRHLHDRDDQARPPNHFAPAPPLPPEPVRMPPPPR